MVWAEDVLADGQSALIVGASGGEVALGPQQGAEVVQAGCGVGMG